MAPLGDLTIEEESYGNEDRSWLGSEAGTQHARTATLSADRFDLADPSNLEIAEDGSVTIPSGTWIARITEAAADNGLWGPFGAAGTSATEVGVLYTTQSGVKAGRSVVAQVLDGTGAPRIIRQRLPEFPAGAGMTLADVEANAVVQRRFVFIDL